MLQDTPRTDAARDAESLENRVYPPELAIGNRQIRGANPLIAVPVTLLGYLVLGLLGWQLIRNSRSLLTAIPKSIAVDLLDTSEAEAPSAPAPAPPPPAGGGPPPGAIQRADAPPPPLPANTDAVPEQQPTALPTQDLSGVAFPTQPAAGTSGTGIGTGTGSGNGVGGTEEGTGTSGTGHGLKVVVLEYSDVTILYKPTIPSSDYPRVARAAGIKGTVKVELLVGVDGIPISAHAYEGPSMLRANAEAIGMRYRFKPEIREGVPVTTRFSVPIDYRIN